MKILQSLLAAALFALAAPALAQQPATAPDVPEIAPAPAAKGDCEKCKQGGMGKMAQGGIDGMAGCKGKQGDAARGGCEKCGQGGMGRIAHGGRDGMAGMQHAGAGKGCCGGMGGMQQGGMRCCGGMGGGDSAALERRIAELEKRLDLMQQLLAQPPKR